MNSVLFRNLETGDKFKYEGQCFIKIDYATQMDFNGITDGGNAINLLTGELMEFYNEHLVYRFEIPILNKETEL